ncbi:MAG TPA: hypothetical protein VLB09_01500 [Nitrospiria bacterium]|nr:hypothetical protein [Nitrospiria bacterium]
MTFLHILKEKESPEALAVIKKQVGKHPGGLGVVLIQEAVGTNPELDVPIYILDGSGKPKTGENVDEKAFLDLILSAEKVVVW